MPKKRGNHEGTIVRRKDGRWMASISIGHDPTTGKLKRVSFYGKTRKEGADLLAQALGDLHHGAFVALHKLTVGQWLETWLRDYKQAKICPLTFDNYERLIRGHLLPTLGTIPLKELRPEHVQQFYNQQRQAGLSAGTIRVIHAVLHGALRQAMRNQLVMRNVSEATERPSGKTRRMTPLTKMQVGQLLTAIAKHRLYPAILLGFGTGLRRGELLALRWQDVDLEAGVLHVRQTLERVRNHATTEPGKRTCLIFQEPKTEQSRHTIPIPADIAEVLKQHKARHAEEKLRMGQAYTDYGLVFCWPHGTPLDPEDFRKRFVQPCQQAGLPPIRLHDTRHTFATLMLKLGQAPKTVQTMLGHTTIATTLDIYSHVPLDLEKQAAAKLNLLFREAVSAP